MYWGGILWLLLVCFIVVLVVILWLVSVGVVVVRIGRVVRFLSVVEERGSCVSALSALNFLARS
jgi:hypothetical protein